MLKKTRQRIVYRVKERLFDYAGLHEVVETRTKNQLEDSMGFRGQFDEHRRFQIAMLKEQGLKPQHRLLEIGCGPLTAAVPIIEYLESGHYVGIDVRSSVLDLSWAEIGKAKLSNKNPRLVCSANFGSDELGSELFDFILSFSVLYHLNDELLERYFANVGKRLASPGVCVANVNTKVDSSTWLEFPFLKRTLKDYETVARKAGIRMEALGELRQHGFKLAGAESENVLLRFIPVG